MVTKYVSGFPAVTNHKPWLQLQLFLWRNFSVVFHSLLTCLDCENNKSNLFSFCYSFTDLREFSL